MLFLLDASVLIGADAGLLALDRVPEFWEWLLEKAREGRIKIPREMYEEIVRGGKDDRLVLWIEKHKDDLVLADEASRKSVSEVTSRGYAPDLTEVEVEKTGRDPFLIAYAFNEPEERCIVTEEVSRPTATRGNRKIPDVCSLLRLHCCDTVELIRRLDFRTRKS